MGLHFLCVSFEAHFLISGVIKMKKVISVFLAVLMLVTMFPLSVFAEEKKEQTTDVEQKHNYNEKIEKQIEYENITIPVSAVYNNGSYYQIYNNCTTWQEAKTYCRSLDGHLAVIDDEAENSFLYEYIISQNIKNAYFGYSDADVENEWSWLDGYSSDYENWHSGEPNSENANEDYAMFYYKFSDGTWNDGDFGNRTVNGEKYFICEWDFDNKNENVSGGVDSGYCGIDGDNLTWTLYNDGELVIYGTGAMENYEMGHPYEQKAPWNEYRSLIKKITIDDGISSIGAFSFKDCFNLESVELSDTVNRIEDYAFCKCTKLESVYLPINLQYIGAYAFSNCDSLLINEILKNIPYIPEGLFADCDNIEKIVIPDNVSGIELCAFESCDNLTNVTIPYSVTYIGLQAFDDCDNINTVYYTGSEAQWNSIDIGKYNEDLTNANIIFNSTSSDTTHNYTYLNYYGKNIAISYCDNDDFVEYYLFDFNNDNIKELVVKETDRELSNVSGSYFNHEYYHFYTFDNGVVYLEKIDCQDGELTHKEDGTGIYFHFYPGSGYYGREIITIENNKLVKTEDIPFGYLYRWPDIPDPFPMNQAIKKDGYLAVKATKKAFNKNTYKADLWLGLNPDKESILEHTIVSNIMNSTGNMTDNYIKDIESDKGFMTYVKWNETADFLFNITDGVKKKIVGKKDLYEMLLFDMMQMQLYGASFKSNFAAELIDEYKNVESVFSTSVNISGTPFDFGTEFMKLKKGTVNIDDYSKALFNDTYIKSTFKSLDNFGLVLNNILKFADTIEDFYTKMSSYIAAKKMTGELKTFFMEIHNNADNEHLADAAEELVRASESILDALNIATEDAAFDMSLQMADIWIKVILSEIPGLNMIVAIYEGLGAVHETTKLLSDVICASESNRNTYYMLKATAELCNTAKKAMQNLADDYIANRTESDALNFIEAINMYSILKAIECKSSLSFFDSVCNEGMINKNIKMGFNTLQFLGCDIKNPQEVYFSSLCESSEALLEASQKQLYILSSSWLLNDDNLKSDYPEIYNYYIEKELEYPEYADSYKPVLYYAKLNNDFSVKFYVNSLENIDGIEIREYSDKSQDKLLNKYIVPNEKEILHSNLDKKNEFPRTYTVSGYFDAAEGTDVDKIYSAESNSKTLGNYNPVIWNVLTDYEEKSAKIMIFDKSSSDLDIVYHIYRRVSDGDFIKISSFDKNTGLLGWFNGFTDYNLSEDVVYTYCVQSEISFSNGVTLRSNMSNTFKTKLTEPTENNQNEVDVEVVLLNEPALATYSMRSNNQATSVSSPVGIKLSWIESENASGYEILRKPSYSEIYSSIGITYENSYTDYNISSGESYDYMVVEFSETEDGKVYQNNLVSETVDCSTISIYTDTNSVNVGETIKINAHTYPATAVILWSSNDTSIATVDANGLLTALSAGTIKITAMLDNGLSDEIEITVIAKDNVQTLKPGDLNGDGKVTASDARTALRISAKLETPTKDQFMAADVNGDGRITASDARTILRVSAKLETL